MREVKSMTVLFLWIGDYYMNVSFVTTFKQMVKSASTT